MATLTPPPGDTPASPRRNRAGAVGAFLGVLVGFVVCAACWAFLVLTVGLALGNASARHTAGECAGYAAWGVGFSVAAIGLGILAWYLLVRVKQRGFSIQFVRGFVLISAIFNLAPWPCSLTGAAYFAFTACR
jgi:formate-dependent nitrite reductase membrane component NrfD